MFQFRCQKNQNMFSVWWRSKAKFHLEKKEMEMRIPLEVMVGGAEDNECSYTDFEAVELHKLHLT